MTCTHCGAPSTQPSGHCATCGQPTTAVPAWSQSEGVAAGGVVARPAYEATAATQQADDAPSGLPQFGATVIPDDAEATYEFATGEAPQPQKVTAGVPDQQHTVDEPSQQQHATAPEPHDEAPSYAPPAPHYTAAHTPHPDATPPHVAPANTSPTEPSQAARYSAIAAVDHASLAEQNSAIPSPGPYGPPAPMLYQAGFAGYPAPKPAGNVLSTIAIVLAAFAMVVGIFVNPIIAAAGAVVCAAIGLRRGERLAKLGLILGIVATVFSLGLLALNFVLVR